MPEPELESEDVDHPMFRRVETAIFTRRLAADCMTHRCTMVDQHREKLDACCQYGADVDLKERDAIMARAADIRALLRDDARDVPWFEDAIEVDPDFPSGAAVRTARVGDGCLFLAHDRRGCAIHRASLERGWDVRGVKPAICRLFPLTYEGDVLEIAEEYPEYSCAHVDGPTLYRITRDTLAELFGPELVVALDAVEQRVLAREPRKLPVLVATVATPPAPAPEDSVAERT